MAHYRKTIRDAVVAQLAGITFDGNAVDVYPNRVLPFWKTELPCIAVYFLSETADDRETAWRTYFRELSVRIELMMGEYTDSTDDQIDSISEQVEVKMFADPTISDTVDDSLMKNTEMTFTTEGDVTHSSAVIDFMIKYTTEAPESSTLDDFNAEHTEYVANSDPDSTIESETTL